MKIALGPDELLRNPGLFDWSLRNARSPGDEIVVLPGAVALTRGSWAFEAFQWIGLAAGVKLVISRDAVVRLAPDAERMTGGELRPSRDLNVLWIGPDATVTGGGIIDGNFAAHPGWSCGGIRAFGRCSISDLSIVGLSGSRASQESFAFSATGATGGTTIRGVSVSHCKVDDADSYVSGIYVGATDDNGVESTVEDCAVRLGERGQFAFSSTFRTHFDRCHGEAMRFWYTDTGPGIAIITNSIGRVSYSVVGSVALEKVDRRVVVHDSAFEATGTDGARWVEWWNKGGAGIGAVVVISCQFKRFKWRAATIGDTGAVAFITCTGTATDGDVGSLIPILETIA